jgi:hypothetical protein
MQAGIIAAFFVALISIPIAQVAADMRSDRLHWSARSWHFDRASAVSRDHRSSEDLLGRRLQKPTRTGLIGGLSWRPRRGVLDGGSKFQFLEQNFRSIEWFQHRTKNIARLHGLNIDFYRSNIDRDTLSNLLLWKGNNMTNVNIKASNEPQKPATSPAPANPQHQQGTPKPSNDKPAEQQK